MHRLIPPASRPLLALTCLLLTARVAVAGADPSLAERVAPWLPNGSVTVDILTPSYDRQTEDTAVRLYAAARRNPAWFQAYSRRYTGGDMPWHPNLGVSRVEYARFQIASRQVGVSVSQRATLRFERLKGGHRWLLHGWGKLQPLEGMLIDLDANAVTTPRRGALVGQGIGEPREGSRPTLPWRWYAAWASSHRVGNPLRGGQSLDATLHIGPIDNGATALYWTYRRIQPGAPLQDEFLMLRWSNRR